MAGPPVVPVSLAKATVENIPTEIRVIGTVEASAIVQVKSQIAGELTGVHFTEGQNVAKGDLLFDIDPRPYEDALHQAEAAVERDRAQIAQAEATLAQNNAQARYAESDAKLQSDLRQGGLTSRSQFDQSQANADAAKAVTRATQASIDSARAALNADTAAVAAAKLNLIYCQIHAPISGRTGNLLVHGGNLVKVNDVPLVVIHQVSPIFVNFSVPEQHLPAIRRLSANHKLGVRVESKDDPGRSASGYLTVIDNTVDNTTGTIHLKATFVNHDGMLWPGQFVTAVLTLDTVDNATVVPSEAVQNGQQGQYVYAVGADNAVQIRPVQVARALGNRTIIAKGVSPGDTVVVDGQLMLFPGAHVKPVDASKLGTGSL
ncbi:MAG TPA: efflux RND transporter periplasmic adaptor subunit [Bryobacteraceae bacterium]|nr:efflux RND transporter periplasmic adaptor subunit [Bryobacteraceae bacterium]